MARFRIAVHITPRKGLLDPQGNAVKMNEKIQSHPFRLSTAKYMIIAGASPNVIASTSESSSDPKRDPVPVARATLPSSASHTPPNTT